MMFLKVNLKVQIPNITKIYVDILTSTSVGDEDDVYGSGCEIIIEYMFVVFLRIILTTYSHINKYLSLTIIIYTILLYKHIFPILTVSRLTSTINKSCFVAIERGSNPIEYK